MNSVIELAIPVFFPRFFLTIGRRSGARIYREVSKKWKDVTDEVLKELGSK